MRMCKLREFKIPVVVKSLDVGDYIIGDKVFERKTIQDLLSSAITGERHLWKQLDNLKRYAEFP